MNLGRELLRSAGVGGLIARGVTAAILCTVGLIGGALDAEANRAVYHVVGVVLMIFGGGMALFDDEQLAQIKHGSDAIVADMMARLSAHQRIALVRGRIGLVRFGAYAVSFALQIAPGLFGPALDVILRLHDGALWL